MKKIIFCLLFSSIIFSSINLHSEKRSDEEAVISEEATPERMAILKLLMHKNLMLTFVSHPKTMEYFLREKQRKSDYLMSLRMQVEELQRQFPSDPLMKRFVKNFSSQIYMIQNPFPYEEIIMPFLAWGIANLYGVQDHEIVKRIQDLQVKLFKNYLYREGIGGVGTDLTQEIALFSQNCPLPIFSQIIRPLVEGLLERDAEIDDIVEFYSSENCENLSDEQEEELEQVYNLPNLSAGLIKLPSFKPDLSGLNLEFNKAFLEKIEQQLSPCGKEKCSSADAIDNIYKNFQSQRFFSLEQLIELFFEIMVEAYPDHKAFFGDVQQGKAIN